MTPERFIESSGLPEATQEQWQQVETQATAAVRDFGVRKDTEKHLAQMEARYRGLLEAAPDGMVVVNQAGEIVLLNAQAERQFGYRRDELLGQEVKKLIPEGFAERLIADGTRTAAEALAQQIGTGIELYGRRKDGTGFPIEIMLSPLQSSEGILVTAAIRNISVRKAAETHLAQMESRYRGLLEAAPDAMVVVNQTGEIVLKLADIVDIAATPEIAMATYNRHVNRRAGIAQRLSERMHTAAVVGRAMNQHHHLRAAALINPIAKLGAIARSIGLHRRQIAEINVGERFADRGQRRLLHRRIEHQHTPECAQNHDDQTGESPEHFAHPLVLGTGG